MYPGVLERNSQTQIDQLVDLMCMLYSVLGIILSKLVADFWSCFTSQRWACACSSVELHLCLNTFRGGR